MKCISILFIAIVLFCGCNRVDEKLKSPNIILVFVDDLGYGDLGCYGQKLIQTPNIDRMAKEGVRFTDFYSAFPVCSPSRCALLTGKHGGHSFVRHNLNVLPLGQLPVPQSEKMIPELLKEKGYATGAFGKWGIGAPGNQGDPLKHGFDTFYGYYCQCKAHNYYPAYIMHNADTVFLNNTVVPVKVNFIDYPLSYATKKVDYSPTFVFDEAMDFIQNNSKNPFFLYYASTLPHSNGEAPSDEKFEVPDWGIYADSSWLPQEKGYASMITMLDDQMGRLMQKLNDLGIAENTLVIFTSDNGPTNFAKIFQSSSVFKGRKRDLYEAGIRMPFVAWWPGKVPANRVVEQPAAMYDLLATFCDIAHVQSVPESDGRSLLSLLKGQKMAEPEFLYWEFYEGERSPKQAIRMGDWKLMRFFFDDAQKHEIELYNLKSDREEQDNVAAQHPDLVKKMIEKMDAEHIDYPFKNSEGTLH